MKKDTRLQSYVIFDIETCRKEQYFCNLVDYEQTYWIQKHKKELENKTADEIQNHWEDNGSFFAEWGQILCASFGYIDSKENLQKKTFSQSQGSEKEMLKNISEMLDKCFSQKTPEKYLTGWNILDFDIPFLAKRMIKHGIKIPKYFRFNDFKSWDTRIIDMMKTWEFGKWGAKTKLDVVCHLLNIESPKSDISGVDVAPLYFQEKCSKEVLERIDRYCEEDVRATLDILRIIHPLIS